MPEVAPSSVVAPTGIDVKRPLFGGACKACPWGVLASVTKAALAPAGYDVQIWVCWSTYGPREMSDKTKPVMPVEAPDIPKAYLEQPPNFVPDISATGDANLIAAWNGTGPYAKDHKERHNYRVVAVVQQPNFLMIAANKKSGITDLSQVKDRTAPTWIVVVVNRDAAIDKILAYYGITEAGLKAHGGGIVDSFEPRPRAAADLFIGGALLADTPEQRIWYQASQHDDLTFFDIPAPLLDEIATIPGFVRVTAPLALLRGVDRPIQTVMRAAHDIYVREDAPDSFTYDVAKALDEHQELFRMYGDPFYYDTRLVAESSIVPMAPGALKYYHERGYVK
jgi:uncharacterized protein